MNVSTAQAPRNDILEGPLDRPILRLMWPIMAGYIFQASFSVVDMYWVGRLGADAMAAVGASSFVVWMLVALSEMVGIGALSLAARFLGAGEGREAGRVLGSSLVVSVVISLAIGLLGVLIAPQVFGLTGTEPEVTRLGSTYLRILFFGVPTLFIFFVMEALFRAGGNTTLPTIVLASIFVLNIVLDPFLIFGWGPFPELGVGGAALATVISRAVGALILGVVMVRYAHELGYRRPKEGAIDVALMIRILKVGVPGAVAGAGFSIIYLFVVRVVAIFGTIPVAALAVGLRTEGIWYFITSAFGRATAAIVGQNLGAEQPERAEAATRRAIFLAEIAMVASVILFLTLAPQLVGLFIEDPEVVAAGANFLRIISFSMAFLAIEVILFNVAAGSGDTVPAMLIEIPGTALRIPLGLFLGKTLGMGYTGVFWAIALTVVLKAGVFYIWFRSGRWKRKEI